MIRTLCILLMALMIGGTAQAALTMSKSVATGNDPFNNALLPKAIPGARMDYTITVSNALGQSTARNIVISDSIPARLKFYVGSSNPVVVTLSLGSSLTYTYTSLSSTTDGVDFSSDNGATWTYTPVAGADGSDPNVTNIRVQPGGSQTALDSFTIKFSGIVK